MAGSGRRRRPAGAFVAGAGLLALAWTTGHQPPSPLGDAAATAAASTSPSSYRYCTPPPGSGSPPASQIDHNIVVLNGVSPAIDDRTAETPPQAELHIPAGAFAVPPRTVAVRVTILCAPPPAMLPADGPLDGNVYTFAVAAQGLELTPRPGAPASVVLRGPAGVQNPVLEQFASGLWTRLDTRPVGGGGAAGETASVTQLGTVGLVLSTAVVPVGSGGDHTALIIALTLAAVVVFGAGAAVTMRGRAGVP